MLLDGMSDKADECALCAAGKGVLTGRKWPEHLVRLKVGGSQFECHVRCTPETPTHAIIVAEIKRNLATVAPRKGLRKVISAKV